MDKILINWGDVYCIGNEEIDKQHKKLVDIINKLYTAFLRAEANQAVSLILEEMVDYTKYHFAYEEGLLKKISFPTLTEHIALHQKFVKRTQEFIQEHKQNSGVLSYDIMNFLRKWLMEHIADEDRKYVGYLLK